MTSVALARKWRPKSFDALVGQDHVANALIHSLDQLRLHHAYLFTGTRGVGKTSIARLFAKALNCEQGVSAHPCLHCDSCLAIDTGSYIDLIEIDAASNTRVEDVRELLDNVPYAPTIGRYKVYLIDEVHMLSQHSFNALLKTLEEPPQHVKFLLATTDPQKLPATILSRCLQFHLRPISASLIAEQLKFILTQEKITDYEEDAIQLLAKSADGSMRDALSLLDQAIAAGQGHINAFILESQLNLVQTNDAEKVIEALAARDASSLLQISLHIAVKGGNYEKTLQDIILALHQLSLLQVLESSSPLFNDAKTLLKYQHAFTQEELQLMYQIALKGSQDILITPTLAIGFEMTLLRMHTFIPASVVKTPLKSAQPRCIAAENDSKILSTSLPENTSCGQDVDFNRDAQQAEKDSDFDVNAELQQDDIYFEPKTQEPQNDSDLVTKVEEVLLQDSFFETTDQEPQKDTDFATKVQQQPVKATILTEDPTLDSEFHDMDFLIFDDVLPIDEITTPPMVPENNATNTVIVSDVNITLSAPQPLDTDWQTIITKLKLNGLAHAAVEHASLLKLNEHELILGVSGSHRSLFTPTISKKIEQAIQQVYQLNLKLTLQELTQTHLTPAIHKQRQLKEDQQQALEILEKDPVLQTIKQVFSAEIHKDSVELIKDGI